MNRAMPDMLHCLNIPGNVAGNGTDISVLERQRGRMKWQRDLFTQQQRYFDENELGGFSFPAQVQHLQGSVSGDTGLNELVSRAVKVDPGLDSGWPNFSEYGGDGSAHGSNGFGVGSGFDPSYGLSRTMSCPTAVAAAVAESAMAETKQAEPTLPEKMSSVGRESFKKRKADKNQSLKAVAEEEAREKRMKGSPEEGESKITEQNSTSSSSKNISNNNNNNNKREDSSDNSKENSKVSEVKKPDYIHVRARRGQATDSHSLAERVRREKISERMKYLQDLVPGCNKITGKAGMLDEIINYVQSLQRQVEFLSMKLAAVNPTLDFNIDNFSKEVFPACASNFPVGLSSEIANPAYLHLNPLQIVQCIGLEVGTNGPEMATRRNINSSLSIPETYLDSSCLNYIQPTPTWDANIQNLYSVELLQGRSTAFPAQQFAGSSEAGNLKMEM
ncbi:hypothetical protein NMG60_11015426 [Bertholletia excelsa]